MGSSSPFTRLFLRANRVYYELVTGVLQYPWLSSSITKKIKLLAGTLWLLAFYI